MRAKPRPAPVSETGIVAVELGQRARPGARARVFRPRVVAAACFLPLLCLVLAFVTGASRAQAAPRPKAALFEGCLFDPGQVYGSHKDQRFDVYRKPGLSKAPILVMVHGGAWRHGDKLSREVVVNKVNHWGPRGWIFVSVNYRLEGVTPLQQAEDLALALARVQSRAAEWGGSGERVLLMGHSAGAHLAALVSVARELREQAGVRPLLGTVCLDSAAYDVEALMGRPHLRLYDAAFGSDPRLWREASPQARATQACSPLLAVCSSQRADSPLQSRRFCETLKGLGARAEVLPVNLDHGQINAELGRPGDYTRRVAAFMDSLLVVTGTETPESTAGN